MRTNERREMLLDVLIQRRQDTAANLASEFGVTERTIRSDIEALTSSYPLETIRSRYGGGVKVADWYRQGRKYLTGEQVSLLNKLSSTLEGDDSNTMNSILVQFAPASRRNR